MRNLVILRQDDPNKQYLWAQNYIFLIRVRSLDLVCAEIYQHFSRPRSSLYISQVLITIGHVLLHKLYLYVATAVIFLYRNCLHKLQELKHRNPICS